MEDRALILAHGHARKAATDTSRFNIRSASNEHNLAAKEFTRAAEGTCDSEALRILRLLEQHHEKLAEILRSKDQRSRRDETGVKEQKPNEAVVSPIKSAIAPSQPFAGAEKHTPTFLKGRDASSSLAKDIASRRGIPQMKSATRGSTTVSSVQAMGRITASSGLSADHLGESTVRDSKFRRASSEESQDVEGTDGFSRFYSSLTSGPLSKLSSMLAFAGLPLTEQDESPASSHTAQTSARVPTGPDPNRIFSKAALRALEEQQRHPGYGFGPHESFYVIPTSGGTASYATILSKTQRDGESHLSGTNEDVDEFVDAREVIDKPDVHGRPTKPSLREEELSIENEALKQILDKLSHRLQAFESHAQDVSMHALAQSMTSVRPPVSTSIHEMETRMRAMENQLGKEMTERERLAKEGRQKDQVIARYRSKWDQLKDSARAKDKAKRDNAGGAGRES